MRRDSSSSSHIAVQAIESDASLAARFFAEETAAFTLLVERYHDFVFRICFAILRHRQDAEDATQETFSRLARNLERWDPRRPMAPWLATVAGNRSRTQLAKRRSHASLGAVAEPPTQDGGQALAAANHMREEITLALTTIPDRQRIAFEMFHEQSLSYVEIAERMGCPVGTVKTLVHRARAGLIDQLRRREIIAERTQRGCQ
ncbi:MAG: RNA polymerase sigma factor [Planctomycetota bacterium]